MKKTKTKSQPNRRHTTVLRQIVELIPGYLVPKLARETGAEERARTFSPWSHVVTMLYAQVSHALGLNDVCAVLRLRVTALFAMRGATPPARNTLSHANKERDCALAEQLFWKMLAHLQTQCPGFARGGKKSLAWRFRRAIHVIDSTTIQLVANCLDWAKHRRRKAAAKRILKDELVVLKVAKTAKDYPAVMRRVTALVEVDGKERVMVFPTNHLPWSPVTVCDLYRCRCGTADGDFRDLGRPEQAWLPGLAHPLMGQQA